MKPKIRAIEVLERVPNLEKNVVSFTRTLRNRIVSPVDHRLFGHLLVSIPSRNHQINQKVDEAKDCQKPEEVIEMATVQIIRDPSQFPTLRGHVGHDCDQEGTQIVPQGRSSETQSGAQASHCVGGLIVVELHLPHEGEDFRTSDEEILRNLPEDRDRNGLLIVEVVAPHVA